MSGVRPTFPRRPGASGAAARPVRLPTLVVVAVRRKSTDASEMCSTATLVNR